MVSILIFLQSMERDSQWKKIIIHFFHKWQYWIGKIPYNKILYPTFRWLLHFYTPWILYNKYMCFLCCYFITYPMFAISASSLLLDTTSTFNFYSQLNVPLFAFPLTFDIIFLFLVQNSLFYIESFLYLFLYFSSLTTISI